MMIEIVVGPMSGFKKLRKLVFVDPIDYVESGSISLIGLVYE